MNLLFWHKAKDPVAKAPVMTELEQAMLDDLKANPSKWRHRRMTIVADSFRSDQGPVTIVVVGNPGSSYELYSASCGVVRFSVQFARKWFDQVRASVLQSEQLEQNAAKSRVLTQLNSIFVE